MSAYIDPQLIFLGIVFLAVVLAAEGVYLYYRDVRGPQRTGQQAHAACRVGRFKCRNSGIAPPRNVQGVRKPVAGGGRLS